jgi:hypothetical protein
MRERRTPIVANQKHQRLSCLRLLSIAFPLLYVCLACTQRENRVTESKTDRQSSLDVVQGNARTPAIAGTDPQISQSGAAASEPQKPTSAVTVLSEQDKIEALIQVVEKSGCTFIRNGVEYPSPQAADHLRSKWRYAGDRIQTARAFIDNIASKSSMTGQPYHIKESDGNAVTAEQWLNEALARIEHP